MDKLNALKYFCSAAETLQFREIALRLSVSPQVVTRVIAELEQHLGEQLFTRNTRNIHLTEFGAAFLPRAQQLLADSENLFSAAREKDEIRGIVRITVPQWNDNGRILARLLEKCADYPKLYIDWRSNDAKLNAVENQLDIGIRIGTQAEDLMIVRKICDTTDKIVASPAYLARHGTPQSLDELTGRFPASSLINANTNRPWGWPLNAEMHVFPKNIRFITDDPANELAAALVRLRCRLYPRTSVPNPPAKRQTGGTLPRNPAPPVATLYLLPATHSNFRARVKGVQLADGGVAGNV